MKRKEAGGIESFLTGTAINGGALLMLCGITYAGMGIGAMRQQVSDGVSHGDVHTLGRDSGEITREHGYDQAWNRMWNWEDTYRKGDMQGTELAGQHIDGSTEFILGEVGMGLGFLVWSSAMLLRHFHRG